jgi:hypothetical protein
MGAMAGKDHDKPVPEADAIDQARAIGEEPDDLPGSVGDRPEADAIEQARSVVEERAMRSPSERGEVPEADWFEQSIVEPFDDEVR